MKNLKIDLRQFADTKQRSKYDGVQGIKVITLQLIAS